MRDFAEQAANRLYDLLTAEPLEVAGVGWGATVASIINGLVMLGRPPRRQPAWFVPTCGEPLTDEGLDVSSSGLAKTLDETINGSGNHHLSLAGVPALIPLDISEGAAMTEVVEKLVRRGKQYRKAFVEPPESFDDRLLGPAPLIDRLQAIVTSLAPPKQPHRLYPEEQVQSGIKRAELEILIHYDIGGVNIARNDLSAEELQRVALLNARWTGITLQQYEACADRAISAKTAGVIVVAIGANKSEPVFDCVCRGLVNELLIDDDLAVTLAERVDALRLG